MGRSDCTRNKQIMLISVVMPVHNGRDTLGRAVRSLREQAHPDWELIAVDDGSTDGSHEQLVQWSRQDGRIRVLRSDESRGPAAARNRALRHARGSMVSYLDCDDEYYADFLRTVDRFHGEGSVQIFGYDVKDDDHPERPVRAWDPSRYKNILFGGNLAVPMGVAHRLDLAAEVGGFDEELWALEDWDLWRRMARTGAEFLFLPFKSGLYHVRTGSRSRSPRLTQKQRIAFQSRLETGEALYRAPTQPARSIKRVLVLTSFFPFLAPSSAAREFAGAVHLLSRMGFECQGFCPSKWEAGGEEEFEAALAGAGLPFSAQDTRLGPHAARMIYTRVGRIPVSVLRTASVQPAEYQDDEAGSFLDYFERFLLTFRPDAMIALNPGPQPDSVFDLAFHVGKSIDIPTVLWLGEESAINLTVMQNVDHCVVHSESLRRRFWDASGLVCKVLPHAFDWDGDPVAHRESRLVTVLARDSAGESRVAAKLLEKLRRVRPDIPVMAMTQDGRPHPFPSAWSRADGIGAGRHGPALSPDPVVSDTRILVIPSLGHGLFDRSVAESMLHGIPVLVSRRGTLPETVGAAGLVLDLPACYQPDLPLVPRADDISPWVDAIARLWDDPSLYLEVSDRCAAHAQRWHPSRAGPSYEEFFRHLCPQPGPPLLPRWSDDWVRRLELPEGGGRE